MKNASEYGRRIRRLLRELPLRANTAASSDHADVADELVRAALLRYAPHDVAVPALRRLRAATVDLNELRVTPVDELVELLGDGFPQAREAAETVCRLLTAVFNRCHKLDLGFIRSMPRRQAQEYLQKLDGADAFITAMVLLRPLGHHAVPIDDAMLGWLRAADLIPADASPADAQSFFARLVPAGRGEAFVATLRQQMKTAARQRLRITKASSGGHASRTHRRRGAATVGKRAPRPSTGARRRANSKGRSS